MLILFEILKCLLIVSTSQTEEKLVNQNLNGDEEPSEAQIETGKQAIYKLVIHDLISSLDFFSSFV